MTDPYDLDYRGPLNPIWMHVGIEVPCTLHPDFLIRADGCAYCRRIRSHLNAQLAMRAIERERELDSLLAEPDGGQGPTPGGSAVPAALSPEAFDKYFGPIINPELSSGPSFADVPIAPGQHWTRTRGCQFEKDPVVPMAESPFVSFGEATLHIGDMQIPATDVKWDERPTWNFPRAELQLTAGSLPDVSLKFTVLSADFTKFASAMLAAVKQIAEFADVLRLAPHGIGSTPCACHPAPFPAARDYRRRTKHRNRRKR